MRILSSLIVLVATNCPAATYYVRNGGDDSADGRSHATAWASIDKVNDYSFSAGDRVLFHEGDRWVGRLVVDWSGSASKHVVIGAYYLEDGWERRGFKTERPVLDGAEQLPSGGLYDALVKIAKRDWVRIENLRVTNSKGRGVAFETAAHAAVVDVVVDGVYVDGIHFLSSDHGLIKGSLVTHAGLTYARDGRTHSWAAAITFVDSNHGHVMGNTIAETYGEGINANHGSTGTLIEKNRIFGARAVGIYADAAPRTTIRRNIVVGTSNSAYWRGSDSVGAGIAVNNERYHYAGHGGSLSTTVQSRDAKIYSNLVAFTSAGLAMWSELAETSHDNLLVLNNTFVDNGRQIVGLSAPAPGGRLTNNLLLSLSPGTRDVDTATLSGMTAKHNYFSQGDPGGDLSHAGNRYTGVQLERMAGWRTVGSLEEVAWQSFVSAASSSTVGGGANEPLQMSTSTDTFHLDFNEQTYARPMDIGALRHSPIPHKVPKHPEEVTAHP